MTGEKDGGYVPININERRRTGQSSKKLFVEIW